MTTPEPTATDAVPAWRAAGADERRDFVAWVLSTATTRSAAGQSEYGDQFQGDPLAQIVEEQMDSLFYSYYLYRERSCTKRMLEQGRAAGCLLIAVLDHIGGLPALPPDLADRTYHWLKSTCDERPAPTCQLSPAHEDGL